MSNTDLLSGDVAAAATNAEPGESNGTAAPKRRSGGLSGMVIADLRELATQLGIGDTKGMRKGDLIAAIRERQGKAPRKRAADETLPLDGIAAKVEAPAPAKSAEKAPRQAAAPADKPAPVVEKAEKPAPAEKPVNGAEAPQQGEDAPRREGGARRRRGANRAAGSPDNRGGNDRGGNDQREQRGGDQAQQGGGDQRKQNNRDSGAGQSKQNPGGGQNSGGGQNNADDDEGGRRGRRFRDRRRRGGNRGEGGTDTEIREDDVLLPVAGILDVLDNYAFVRTSGYLPGPNDVYVSLSLVRKHGLRRGDAITGVVKQPREGEQQRQKFNPLVRVDSVNGLDPDEAKRRPEFTKLTPLYPNERLRLETEPHKLTTRVIDLVMPVGKGQRALIVSPPKAGKTTIMQDIANAITTNNPECHLMVVLVDERPEEVTDMQRSVKGEVIASTFDRPPSDHTSVAELSIERAKRLVEMGMDVVVLLDSITRLGRAYNLAAPASGRILSGGVDSTALFPPKRFLGAARNIENGGSLTIFATAMVETGSTGDTVIFEEFKGTGNAELKLDRKIAERRVFPAVDVNPSGTRKEELLLSPDELAVTHKLHRVLHALDSQQAIDLLLSRLRKTKTNIEFLMQVSKTALASDDD
ncbi:MULTISPECIES: transcription termination factor Rho [Amycolatopsis]|uniref:Transcription termination factor Rho n=1 Tax=Amycolatopsis thermoflava TaxID=84480 RepID=A0A3N2GUG0_9PSEU|nr:transcription termination factor Rho [Amycolatopsis thermoflava]ROS39779.1 transcription termination factor Rho [Amycolatopsis thermoflava]